VYGGTATNGLAEVYSDMWRFNTSSNEWTYWKEPSSLHIAQRGEEASQTSPGPVFWAASWHMEADPSKLYLFFQGYLFYYSLDSDVWVWLNDFDTTPSSFGELGIESSRNYPLLEMRMTACVDNNKGFVYFVGGGAGNHGGTTGVYSGREFDVNTIWRLNMDNLYWTWVMGTNRAPTVGDPIGSYSVYSDAEGQYNVVEDRTSPVFGSRAHAFVVMDCYTNIWVYGGIMNINSGETEHDALSDMFVIPRCDLDFNNIYDNPEALQRPCDGGCSSGQYYSLLLDECRICTSGSYSSANVTTCSECDIGYYSEVNESSSVEDCLACPSGTYSILAGSSSCDECPVGKWSSAQNATSSETCTECPAGTYNQKSSASALSFCLECLA